jgi:hypothetical protein
LTPFLATKACERCPLAIYWTVSEDVFSEIELLLSGVLGNSTVLCREFPFYALFDFVPY